MKRVDISLDDSMTQLRAELKREFPGVTFKVTRARGTAYGWVRISWTDGPRYDDVRRVANGYEGSGFDGMTDSTYTISHTAADAEGNPVEVHHGIRSINIERRLSADMANRMIARIVEYWGGIDWWPTATESGWGGYELPADAYRRNIRPDMDLEWSTAIHRASNGQYDREVSA